MSLPCVFRLILHSKHRLLKVLKQTYSSLPENWGQLRLKYKKLEQADNVLNPARLAVKKQTALLEELEKSSVAEQQLKQARDELDKRKRHLEDLVHKLASVNEMDKWQFRKEDLLLRRFYYVKSNSIYNGVPGFFDLGPLGTGIKNNILNLWRKFFIVEEQMLEMTSSVIVPENVLRASGHVDKFSDYLVLDSMTKECYRLDHFVTDHLEEKLNQANLEDETRKSIETLLSKISQMNKEEMLKVIAEFEMKTPAGNDVSDANDFNLMFDLNIGPMTKQKGFLRPELAQGIFTNFKHLCDFNQGKLPFAAAQIGLAFRNEISPKFGLFRLREFTLAEAEIFVDPNIKNNNKFTMIKDLKLSFMSAKGFSKWMTIEEAINEGVVLNQTMAYYMGRTYLFLRTLGIKENKIRFRQHKETELAHYACDCWDVECETYNGWVECVGCADRSCVDLTSHSFNAGVQLTAKRKLLKPVSVGMIKLNPVRKRIGKQFGEDEKLISLALLQCNDEQKKSLADEFLKKGTYVLNSEYGKWMLTKDMVHVEKKIVMTDVEEFVPHVTEFSFGIERIMNVLFDHTFVARDDDKRTFFALRPSVAPIKCSLFPVIPKNDFVPVITRLAEMLKNLNVDYRIDMGKKSIGKKYTYNDEMSIPFAITIDEETLKSCTATLRYRDSMEQVRVPVQDLAQIVADLVVDKPWETVLTKYPKHSDEISFSDNIAL